MTALQGDITFVSTDVLDIPVEQCSTGMDAPRASSPRSGPSASPGSWPSTSTTSRTSRHRRNPRLPHTRRPTGTSSTSSPNAVVAGSRRIATSSAACCGATGRRHGGRALVPVPAPVRARLQCSAAVAAGVHPRGARHEALARGRDVTVLNRGTREPRRAATPRLRRRPHPAGWSGGERGGGVAHRGGHVVVGRYVYVSSRSVYVRCPSPLNRLGPATDAQ